MFSRLSRILTFLRQLCLIGIALSAGGCFAMSDMAPGKMDWVQPTTTQAAHAGQVYLVRGWMGMFSGGTDKLGQEINEAGITAHVFQHDQNKLLAEKIVEQYRNAARPEPICLIGHSYGSDDVIMIARELDKVGVPVDLIVTLDPVDERVVPKNVRLCYNYWQPGGMLSYGNFLRGIPLSQERGSTGQLFNVNLLEEGRDLRASNTGHVNIDEAPNLHKAIVEHLLSVCPDRSTWASMQNGKKTILHASD